MQVFVAVSFTHKLVGICNPDGWNSGFEIHKLDSANFPLFSVIFNYAGVLSSLRLHLIARASLCSA